MTRRAGGNKRPSATPRASPILRASPAGGPSGSVSGAGKATRDSSGDTPRDPDLETTVVVLDALSDDSIAQAMHRVADTVIRCRSFRELRSLLVPTPPLLVVVAPNLPDARMAEAIDWIVRAWPSVVWPLGVAGGPLVVSRMDWAIALAAVGPELPDNDLARRLGVPLGVVEATRVGFLRRTGLSLDDLGGAIDRADPPRTPREGGALA